MQVTIDQAMAAKINAARELARRLAEEKAQAQAAGAAAGTASTSGSGGAAKTGTDVDRCGAELRPWPGLA